MDNTRNAFGVAPDKGSFNGMVWRYSGSFENYMANLKANSTNQTARMGSSTLKRRDSGYWLPELSTRGVVSAQTATRLDREVLKSNSNL